MTTKKKTSIARIFFYLAPVLGLVLGWLYLTKKGEEQTICFKDFQNFEKEILDGKGVWIDHGPDNYAGVTWSDISVKDARRIFIGWMSNWDYAQDVPTETWRSAMTLPRKLSLHRGDLSYRLTSSIISEISNTTKSVALSAYKKLFLTEISSLPGIAIYFSAFGNLGLELSITCTPLFTSFTKI